MMPAPVQVPDWHRFWFGEAPPSFLPEACLRLAILFALLVVSMRGMGRRTASELSRNELLAIVALAGAIGPAVQTPSRGVLPPILIAICVVILQRSIAAATHHSARAEEWMQGHGCRLVDQGVVALRRLRENAVPCEQLFAALRGHGLRHLGQVARVYFEADGSFSIYEREPPGPGLSLVPKTDTKLRAEQINEEAFVACSSCGHLRERRAVEARCACCEGEAWEPPVRSE